MALDNRTCYYPNGDVEEDMLPCTSERYTACCGSRDICMENGLCLNYQDGIVPIQMYRGGCTNAHWDSGCPKSHCSDEYTAMNPVFYLRDRVEELYCCGNSSCDINSQSNIPNSKFIWSRALFHDMVNTTEKGTGGSNTIVEPSPANTSSPDATGSVSETGDPQNLVKIGAGVGVPLGVLALIFLVWALFERRQRLRLKSSLESSQNFAAGYRAAASNMEPSLHAQDVAIGGKQYELGGNPAAGIRPHELENTPVPELMGRDGPS